MWWKHRVGLITGIGMGLAALVLATDGIHGAAEAAVACVREGNSAAICSRPESTQWLVAVFAGLGWFCGAMGYGAGAQDAGALALKLMRAKTEK
jgi:hypothetical protein